jgi:hypothetical protein
MLLPAIVRRKWRLSLTVVEGLLRMSCSRSLPGSSSLLWEVFHPPCSGGKRLPSVGESGVWLERGEADGEKAGGFGLGGATLLECLYYLLSEYVFRISFHRPMIGHRLHPGQ